MIPDLEIVLIINLGAAMCVTRSAAF